MPNPNPVKRTRTAPTVEQLPPGMRRHRSGLISYRYTVAGQRLELYAPTVDEAYRKRYEPPVEVLPDAGAMTLADWLRSWADGLAQRDNTVAEQRRIVHRRLVPLFGEQVTLEQVDRGLILEQLAQLRTHTVRGGGLIAPRTVALAYSTLRTALYAAVDAGRLATNPAARIKPNGTTGKRARGARVGVELAIPTELEVRRLIVATRAHPWGALVPLAAFTGLRQSEALGLQVDDLDLQLRWVTVSHALRRTDRVLDDPKNASSARSVPFHPALAELLQGQLEARDRRELLAGSRWDGTYRLVWSHPDGSPLVGSTVSHWFADACELAGIGHYRYHDLRHYYATNLLAHGVEIGTVAKRLGHINTRITSETYHHVIRGRDDLDTATIAGAGLAAALG